MKQPYLLLGEILRPQGIRGEVKVKHYTDDPARFKKLETVYRREGENYLPIRVQNARVQAEDVFLKLEGTDDRDAAEALRGAELWVDRAHAVPLGEDQVFIADLLGAKAVDTTGKEIGTLTDVLSPATVDVYVFDVPGGTLMVPALKRVVLRTDVDAGMIVLDEKALEEVGLYEDRRS